MLFRNLFATLVVALLVLAATVFAIAWLEGSAVPIPATLKDATPIEVASHIHSKTREQHGRWLLIGSVVALLVGLCVSLLLSRSALAPVKELTLAVQRMVAGDFSVRTSIDGEEELERLAQALNDVARQMETSLREQRREAIRLRKVLNGMQEGVCLTDGGGQIVLSNCAFDKLFRTEATGRSLVDVVRIEAIRKCIWTALAGTDSAQAVDTTSAKNQTQSLLVHASSLEEEGGAVVMVHDVTPIRRADRIRRDFVANASHELRTPLTAIRGFAETLRDGAIDDPAQARRFVDVILRNAIRLQVVADDLLHLSKAEARSQDFDLGPVQMSEVLTDLRENFEEQAKQKGLLFVASLEADPIALSNAVALDRMLVNLISNAFKVSTTGDTVTVHCSEREGKVRIDVSDSGPGISEKHLERIFERFYRIDPGRAADEGGTGLGLAIVKHLAERVDADIEVKSAPGEGTVFTIHLPSNQP